MNTDANSTGRGSGPAAGRASTGADAGRKSRNAAADDQNGPETAKERRLVNVLIIGIILVIFVAAFWLGDALLDARRADECMASGRRNCTPITVPAPPVR